MNKIIVKVQLPLISSEKGPPAYVYSKDKVFQCFVTVNEDLINIMDDEPKKFFYANIKNGTVNLLEEAPWQEW